MRPDGSRVTDNAVYSDDLGNYRLFCLAPGRYRVCASPTERGQDTGGTVLPFVQDVPSRRDERGRRPRTSR